MKKKLSIFLAALTALGCMSACGGSSGSGGKDTDHVAVLVDAQSSKTLASEETISFDINKDISGKDYVSMSLKTDVPLLGKYVYSNVDNPSEVVEEEFFIEAGMTEFTQFLDSFRLNAHGNFKKKMQKFYNKKK